MRMLNLFTKMLKSSFINQEISLPKVNGHPWLPCMMGNPKFANDSSRCVYENDDILVSNDFMSYPDDTKEAVMLVCILKDSKIIRMETGATVIPPKNGYVEN